MNIQNIRVTTAISILAVIAILSMAAIVYLPMFQPRNYTEDNASSVTRDDNVNEKKDLDVNEVKRDKKVSEGHDVNQVNKKINLTEDEKEELDKALIEKYSATSKDNKAISIEAGELSELDKALIEKYSATSKDNKAISIEAGELSELDKALIEKYK